MPESVLLAVDGNGLLHRAHHGWAGSDERDREGRPLWATLGLLVWLGAAAARYRPDAVVVGFDCTEFSLRRQAFAQYKAHRPDKPADLVAELTSAPDLLARAGVPVVCARGYEADDVLASAAARARAAGWRSILVTSDRDALGLIDDHTSVLRVSGNAQESPLLGVPEVIERYGVAPHVYHDLAVLRGDPSDNLPGVPGVGSTIAGRLLDRHATLDGVLAAYAAVPVAQADLDLVGPDAAAYLGSVEGREALEMARRLTAMEAGLPLPALDDLRLPLDPDRLHRALREAGIRLTRSLWALVGAEEPAWTPNGFDSAPSALPGGAPPPWAVSQWFARPEPPEHPLEAPAPPEEPVEITTRRAGRRPGTPRPVPEGQLALF